ncbi:UDP-glucose 4-epimerase [Microbacterium hydrothermale]|uniref:NAD-dependent epimerase/dehydratase family protein n=1 Tax=Microbacterium hydrothermale TaxID=857427 RepID=UPI00222804FA|nr:NAD-dependent epimerase/dehydratase family protein [Microbacterium hydrothermale]MCW2166393.1 UDP-glucose 4-epimerase [Microbacterium hydrothermale]
MARCLIVGANGFLGSRLTDALAEAGHDVTAFDRFSRGTRSFTSDGVTVIAGDFLSTADLAAAIEGQQIVFHFLSTTTPATADGDPTLDLRTNVSQSVELLALCAKARVRRLFYASSGGAIYGPQSRPVYSETAPLTPLSPYGIGKLTVERYLDYYAATEGLASVSLRISNPYGANANPSKRQGIIPITLNRIRRGEPVVQVGDGSMVRDYIHVDDLVRRILRMVEVEPRERAYNLGSGRGHSVREIFEAVRQVVDRDFAVQVLPKPATFVDHVVLDVHRFAEEFGPDDDLSLAEGIARTWAQMGMTA